MSKRSQWCDVSKELRKYIINRDKQCIICGAKKPLTMAHVFLSRAKGGKGCKENIVALCNNCHYFTLDNPIGKANIEKSKKIEQYCKDYLIHKENINYNDDFIENLKYKKVYDIMELKIDKQQNRCGNCIYLIKQTNKKNTLPTYYCKLERKIKAKKGAICKNFKNN